MRAVAERVKRYPNPDRVVWHIARGPQDPDAWFQPVACGGGITLPGGIEQRSREDITCPDCLAGRVTPGFDLADVTP